jgi:hypothetical protein
MTGRYVDWLPWFTQNGAYRRSANSCAWKRFNLPLEREPRRMVDRSGPGVRRGCLCVLRAHENRPRPGGARLATARAVAAQIHGDRFARDYLPHLLGNGKSPAQLGFDNEIGIGLAAILLIARVAITVSSQRAGAEGGLLTPA